MKRNIFVANVLIKRISDLLLKMTEKSAWLNALSLKQQVAGLWSAFLVCSSRQIDCIYLLYEVAGEGINKRSSSQDALHVSCESNLSKIARLQTAILF